MPLLFLTGSGVFRPQRLKPRRKGGVQFIGLRRKALGRRLLKIHGDIAWFHRSFPLIISSHGLPFRLVDSNLHSWKKPPTSGSLSVRIFHFIIGIVASFFSGCKTKAAKFSVGLCLMTDLRPCGCIFSHIYRYINPGYGGHKPGFYVPFFPLILPQGAVDVDGDHLPGDELAAILQCGLGGELQTAAAGHLHPDDGQGLDIVIPDDLR